MRKPDGFEASFKNRLLTNVSTAKRRTSSPHLTIDLEHTSTKRRDTSASTSTNRRSSSPVVEDDEPIQPINGAKESEGSWPRRRPWRSDENGDGDADADEEQDRKVPMWKMYSRASSIPVPSLPDDTVATHDSNTTGLSMMALGAENSPTMAKRKRRATSYANLGVSDEEEDDDEHREDGKYDFVLPQSVSGRRKSNAVTWDRK